MLVKLGFLELKIFSNSVSDHHCFRKIAEVQWQHFVSNSEVRKFLFGYIDDNSISIKDFSGLNICYECHPGGFHIVHCLPRSKPVKKSERWSLCDMIPEYETKLYRTNICNLLLLHKREKDFSNWENSFGLYFFIWNASLII